MSRNKDYQRLLNSKRWKQLREWKLNESPLCEMCAAKGLVVAAVDVHHKIPCESARTIQEMEALCFNPSNLQSLCISCHADLHRSGKSHTKQAHKQRQADSLARWIARHEDSMARWIARQAGSLARWIARQAYKTLGPRFR